MTPCTSIVVCSLLSIIFVFSLYVVHPRLPRSDPLTVRRRIESITFVCLLAPIALYLLLSQSEAIPLVSFGNLLGIKWTGLFAAVCYPPLLVLLLYLGPIVQSLMEGGGLFDHVKGQRNDIMLRNYLFAPVAEEFIFRACMLLVLRPALSDTLAIFICPLFFGIAHIHHVIDWYIVNDGSSFKQACLTVVVQAGYTSLFGLFSGFLFVRTGHLVSLVLCHTLCNLMGLPPIEAALQQPKILFMYLVGIVTFSSFLFPMTSPSLYK